MKIIAQDTSRFVFNAEPGEEMFTVLRQWCIESGIKGATLTGLGAASEVEIAYYNLETKSYERQIVTEDVEILSLTGNIAQLDSETLLHIHGVFGKRDLSTFGGHLFALTVSGACEIHLSTFEAQLTRSYNETTGLNLLCSVPL